MHLGRVIKRVSFHLCNELAGVQGQSQPDVAEISFEVDRDRRYHFLRKPNTTSDGTWLVESARRHHADVIALCRFGKDVFENKEIAGHVGPNTKRYWTPREIAGPNSCQVDVFLEAVEMDEEGGGAAMCSCKIVFVIFCKVMTNLQS